MRVISRSAGAWFLALGLVLSIPAWGQVTGSLSGTVEDQTGKLVPGARVVLTLPDSNTEAAATTTTGEGSFFFPNLRPIFYNLTVDAPGFKTQALANVKIDPTTETSLPPLRLEVGDIKTVTQTTAPSQTLQTSNGEVANTLTQDQVSQLPLFGRDPLQPLGLLDTLPGVSVNGRGLNPTTIDGQSVSFANVTYDGINIQDNFIRNLSLNSTDVLLGLHTDQISEATIVTSNAGTIYSGGSAQVAFSTPSGTNNLRGSLYWLNAPRGLSSQLFLDNVAPATPRTFELNQAGATVGGPIKKDKLFFFANFEAGLNRSTLTQLGTVPTVRATSANPTINQILQVIPSPIGTAGVGFFAGTGFNWVGTQNNWDTTYLGLARLDYNASSKHVFSFSMSMNEGNQDDPFDSEIFSRQPNSSVQNVATFFSGSWRWSPTPRLTNEVRIGASVQRLDFHNSLRKSYPYILDFTDTSGAEPMAGFDPQGQSNRIYNYQDNLTFVKGRHSFQAGFSLQQYREWEYGISSGSLLSSVTVPTYIINKAGAVAGDFQPFNILSPSSGYVPYSVPETKPSANLVSGYFQDNWKVHPRLAINLGVRYDYLSPVEDKSGVAIIPFLPSGSAADAVYNPNLQFEFAGKDQGLYHRDKNNLAPYVGFAWRAGDRLPLVVRGAYNISFVNDDVLRNMSTFALQNAFQTVTPLGNFNTTFPNVPGLAAPQLPSLSLAGLQALAQNLGASAPPPIRGVDPNLRTPYVQQANLGVESQWKNFLFSVRYVGNRLVKGLVSLDRNQITLSPQYLAAFPKLYAQFEPQLENLGFNPVFPNEAAQFAQNLVLAGGANPAIFFPNPQAPNGILLLSNLGRSKYDSLQLSVSRRVTPGLSFTANYVFSRTLSNLADYIQGAFDPVLDIHNQRISYAPSPFDLTHALKMTGIYDLPFAKGFASSGMANKVLGGWSLSGIMIAQSGAPFSLLSPLGTFNTEADSLQNTVATTLTTGQIEQHFGIVKNPNGTVTYVNAPAGSFQTPGPGQTGSLQPRMFHGPAAFNLDLGLGKAITITERFHVEIRAQAINLLNNQNWLVNDQILVLNSGTTTPVVRNGNQVFNGGVNQWTSPRSVQFLLRVRF